MGRDREINFGLGEPDFRTPSNIIESGNRAALEGKTKYTPVGGITELLTAAKEAFLRDSGVNFNADQLIAGSGSTQLISNAIQAAIDISGKHEVVIVTPCWRKYRGIIEAAGGTVVAVKTGESDGFAIHPKDVIDILSFETAAVIINNPCNPTGYMIPERDLKILGEAIIGNSSYIIYDEVYSSISFEKPFVSMAAVSETIRHQTITIESCSKKYSMSGYRIGYCAAPKDIINRMKQIQDNTVWCMNTPAQYAAIEALASECSQTAAAGMISEFRKRRDYMHKMLEELGLKHTLPMGAFSFFVKVPSQFKNSDEFVRTVFDEASVRINPGTTFEQEGYVRLTFCCSMDDIREGMDRIKSVLTKRLYKTENTKERTK